MQSLSACIALVHTGESAPDADVASWLHVARSLRPRGSAGQSMGKRRGRRGSSAKTWYSHEGQPSHPHFDAAPAAAAVGYQNATASATEIGLVVTTKRAQRRRRKGFERRAGRLEKRSLHGLFGDLDGGAFAAAIACCRLAFAFGASVALARRLLNGDDAAKTLHRRPYRCS